MSALPEDSLKEARFHILLDEARRCRVCAGLLPFEPRPVLQASTTSRLLIVSQAPGSKVQQSGMPFSDRSGDRLRTWMGITPETFYDASVVALLPMGFCYPGRGKSGDAPPRRECAPLWRNQIVAYLSDVRLTLLVGTYAQAAVLGPGRMSDRVRDFRGYLPSLLPLPHPSWRSQLWINQNPWFVSELLPTLRSAVAAALSKEPV
ncbi:uracil-DNA glycosylase family protein [Sphingobium aromaticiconvertens]|uniref:uracil-DNA glycosylase family protein n=1 Tax=Sphingobium aromaticiconvertens TaxID=365341 RepID=UPI003019FFF1